MRVRITQTGHGTTDRRQKREIDQLIGLELEREQEN